ncbi:uncharacterized protein LOC115778518 [Archocentrus centrarchus]|uniref:uncharacterized protein LOC115778518 n=1 Tax=Archocentrus centrarchus TaxID=63155 RepID=UPI0011E9CEEB|nr:uncharacterized protein LOC115778518 [Archocentrus centrarchus]
MAATSKSSQKVKNMVIALLALWSIISLIVIVVWATSPDLKGAAQCRTELQEATEKLKAEKVASDKNKTALERMVEEERKKLAQQTAEYGLLLQQLNTTNATLEECRQENVVLNRNISILQETIDELHQEKSNLTVQLGLREDKIDALNNNLTQAIHQTEVCKNLRVAAESYAAAAQAQTKACESSKQHVQKQLQKCKETKSEASQVTQQGAPTQAPGSTAAPLTGIPTLALLICSALHLIT